MPTGPAPSRVAAAAGGFAAHFSGMTFQNPLRGGMVNLSGNLEKDMDLMGVPINPEGVAMMGLTYAAAFTPGSTIGKATAFDDVSKLAITVKFPRNYAPEMTPSADGVDTVARGGNHANGLAPTYVPTRGSPDEYGDYTTTNITMCPDPDAVNMLNTIVRGHNDWKGLFFILHGSSGPQDLTESHFKSFFAWKRTPDIEGQVLAKHFPKITGGLPKIVDDDGLRRLLPAEKWIEYRTTFSSGGLLAVKMLDECPEDYLQVFSDETKDRIMAYSNNRWSEARYREIPEKALGIVYAYLKQTDQLVENLWGFKRAYEKLSVQEKESLKVWFQEAREKMKVYKKGTLGVGKIDMPTGVWQV